LDELLEKGQDLFANDIDREPSQDSSKIFSILPKNSILGEPSHERASIGGQKKGDSLLIEGDRYQSLAGAVSGGDPGDTGSIFSDEGILNRSRGVRPFSPPPMNRLNELDIPKSTPEEEDQGSSKTVIKVMTPVEESSETQDADELNTDGDDNVRGRERRWSINEDTISD